MNDDAAVACLPALHGICHQLVAACSCRFNSTLNSYWPFRWRCMCVCVRTPFDAYHITKHRKKTQTNYKTYVILGKRSSISIQMLSLISAFSAFPPSMTLGCSFSYLVALCKFHCSYQILGIVNRALSISRRVKINIRLAQDDWPHIVECDKRWQ